MDQYDRQVLELFVKYDDRPIAQTSLVVMLAEALREKGAEIERLKRGEYICRKCGLRKDGEGEVGDF